MTKHLECPICNSARTKKILNWKMNYRIFSCKQCEVFFAVPTPSEKNLHEFYQRFQYEKPDDEQVRKRINKRKKELEKVFELTRKELVNKAFLDYGGGTGIVYQAARELGLDVYFQEIDESSIDTS